MDGEEMPPQGEVRLSDQDVEDLKREWQDIHDRAFTPRTILPVTEVAWINYLIQRGSSLLMNWGEDDRCWEVSFITGGERFTSVSISLMHGLREVDKMARDRFQKGEGQPNATS